MDNKLDKVCVSVDGSLRDAMRCLSVGGTAISLVTDENQKLVGVINDGDIRRALLGGAMLEFPLKDFMIRDFTSVQPGAARAEILDLMQARLIEQIPVVDQSGKLAGLHLIHELLGRVERPHWAVIMAGGRGERLRPLTERVPKPMIRVAGRSILERLVLHLVGSGMRRIFITINHLGHIIEEHFGNGEKFGCTIEYMREERPMGTGGGLSLLPWRETNHPILVLNGDMLTDVDVGAIFDVHEAGNFVATLGARSFTQTIPFGCLDLKDGRVTTITEKPALTRFINTGIYVLNAPLLERVPAKEFFMTDLISDCLARGERVGAYEVAGDWMDVGQPAQLAEAQYGIAPKRYT